MRSRPLRGTPPCRNGVGSVEPFVEVPLQQQAHLAELGEHQRLLAGVEQVGDQLVEARQLARPAAERATRRRARAPGGCRSASAG